MQLFDFIDELIRFEFNIFESNLINLLVLGGVVVCYIFFPIYDKFSKRKEYIKSALIKSIKAEEKLRLTLIENYYQIFLKETFWLVSLLFLSRVIALGDADGYTDYYVPAVTSAELTSSLKKQQRLFEIKYEPSYTPSGQKIQMVIGYRTPGTPLPKVFNNPFVSPYAGTCIFTPCQRGSQRRIMGIGSSDNALPSAYSLKVKFIENFKDLWPLVIIAAKDVFFYKKISDRSKHKKPLKTFLSNSDSKIRRIILKQDRRV